MDHTGVSSRRDDASSKRGNTSSVHVARSSGASMCGLDKAATTSAVNSRFHADVVEGCCEGCLEGSVSTGDTGFVFNGIFAMQSVPKVQYFYCRCREQSQRKRILPGRPCVRRCRRLGGQGRMMILVSDVTADDAMRFWLSVFLDGGPRRAETPTEPAIPHCQDSRNPAFPIWAFLGNTILYNRTV